MEQTTKKTIFKVLKITGNVLFYAVIAVLLLYSLIVIGSRGENNIPNVFGNGFLAVETKSMEGDNVDSFNANDLIFVKILNDEQKSELKVGDVITFMDPAKGGALNTHRIVDIIDGGYQTQGDNTREPDFYILDNVDVVAKYNGKLQGLGGFILFIQKPVGFGLIVLLPIFLVLIYQAYNVLMAVFAIKKEKIAKDYEAKKEQDKLALEQQKELMKKELLEELKKEQNKK